MWATRSVPTSARRRQIWGTRSQRGDGIGEAVEEPDGPGKRGDEGDGKVVPEGLVMAVEIGAEAGEVVLEEEDAEELRGAELDEHVPGCGDGEKDGEAQRVEGADAGRAGFAG